MKPTVGCYTKHDLRAVFSQTVPFLKTETISSTLAHNLRLVDSLLSMMTGRKAVQKNSSSESSSTILQLCATGPGRQELDAARNLPQSPHLRNNCSKEMFMKHADSSAKRCKFQTASFCLGNIEQINIGGDQSPKSFPDSSIGGNPVCNANNELFQKCAAGTIRPDGSENGVHYVMPTHTDFSRLRNERLRKVDKMTMVNMFLKVR